MSNYSVMQLLHARLNRLERCARLQVSYEENCPICIQRLEDGTSIKTLQCRHRFHRCCIEQWQRSNVLATCPLCRGDRMNSYDSDYQSPSSVPAAEYGSIFMPFAIDEQMERLSEEPTIRLNGVLYVYTHALLDIGTTVEINDNIWSYLDGTWTLTAMPKICPRDLPFLQLYTLVKLNDSYWVKEPSGWRRVSELGGSAEERDINVLSEPETELEIRLNNVNWEYTCIDPDTSRALAVCFWVYEQNGRWFRPNPTSRSLHRE